MVGKEAAVSIAGRFGRKSWCGPFAETIGSKIEAGLSAQRIYQDLVEEKGFAGSYQSVGRFVRRLKQRQPQRVWRMEGEPGEEMQVDFGLGAPIEQDGGGKTRRSWVLRAVLSYSRKAYSAAVMRQDTESLLRGLENALRHFGGVPLLLNIDNLKAAVLKADWFDPQINPKLADFCRHYRIHVMPCRPRMPQHKGKVERQVSYVRGNALKGRRFKSLAEENAFLSHWEASVSVLLNELVTLGYDAIGRFDSNPASFHNCQCSNVLRSSGAEKRIPNGHRNLYSRSPFRVHGPARPGHSAMCAWEFRRRCW